MKNLLIGVLFTGIILSFGGGFYIGKAHSFVPPIEGVVNMEAGQAEGVDFSLFWDAWRVVQEDYAGQDSLDFQAMVHGAISGMINSLGDPYTTFMNSEDTETFISDIEGSFSGVGMEIGIREGRLQVVAPLEGTPAERAGLRPGDYIVAIGEETFTSDLTIDEAVRLIRGPEGTTVTLKILRGEWTESQDFTIERAVINIPSLRWEIMDNRIGYVKIFQFSEALRSDFRNIEDDLVRDSDKIIIDLRNNPGGFLHIAIEMAGWFVDRGDVVVIEDFGKKEDQIKHTARGNNRLGNHDVVILINGGSASASEILAGALRDNNHVLLIGEKSFGKGSVQELKELKDESSIKITIANWLTPKGVLITGEGLTPDIEVIMEDEDFQEGRDPQLDRAVEVLNNL